MKEWIFLALFSLLLSPCGSCLDTSTRAIQDKMSADLASSTRKAIWYDTELVCDRPGFCAVSYYEEEDGIYSDPLSYVRVQCTNTTVLKHSAQIFLQGMDAFVLDSNYEPRIVVYHDCYPDLPYYYSIRSRKRLGTVPTPSSTYGPRTFRQAVVVDLNDPERCFVPRFLARNYRAFAKNYRQDFATELWLDGQDVRRLKYLFEERVMGWNKTRRVINYEERLCFGDIRGLYDICDNIRVYD